MKKFHLTKNYAIFNFDALTCTGKSEVLNSKSFYMVLKEYLKSLKDEESYLLDHLAHVTIDDILNFYKLLLVYNLDNALKQVANIHYRDVKYLYEFTESFYNYYRKLERFGFLKGSKNYDPSIKVDDLIKVGSDFNNLIITLYRTISQKLLQENFNVFRQLPAGINANMLYVIHSFSNDKKYRNLTNIAFVTKILTYPPFIINSKSNTRSGLFTQVDSNPLSSIKMNKLHYVAFPIYVGPLLAFVYVHRDFLHQAIALSNMFHFANYETYKTKKPDLIYVYGIKEEEFDCQYYIDQTDNTYFGFVSRNDKNDYFGYLKKMLLTLHNVYMINNGNLPIHGAFVKVTLDNNVSKNICIVGDSGAGKSETLEALRSLGNKHIKNMEVVFDDMGTFKILNDQVYANGTETGAFVRLDDLELGYAYQIMDRALFLNPNQVNARVCIPISSYDLILENHQVDYLFYANNYEDSPLKIFNNLDEMIDVFERGVRKAKGTTNEVGITKSFFANPFGPVQLKDKTHDLIVKYFEKLINNKTVIGQLYTKLAVDGCECSGPMSAAKELLKILLAKNL